MRTAATSRLSFAVVVFLGLGPAPAQSERVVTGVVVDAQGLPVGGVNVATWWNASAEEGRALGCMHPHEGAATDQAGAFRCAIGSNRGPAVLLAIDATQQRGGLIAVDLAKDEVARIALHPLIDVRGRFTCEDIERPPSWMNVYVLLQGSRARIASCDSTKAEFAFKLPPGNYTLDCYGSDVRGRNIGLKLTAGETVRDLGTIDLPATGIAKHTGGTPPPLRVTDARGVAKSVSYADFKGKWLLLEFWGYW